MPPKFFYHKKHKKYQNKLNFPSFVFHIFTSVLAPQPNQSYISIIYLPKNIIKTHKKHQKTPFSSPYFYIYIYKPEENEHAATHPPCPPNSFINFPSFVFHIFTSVLAPQPNKHHKKTQKIPKKTPFFFLFLHL